MKIKVNEASGVVLDLLVSRAGANGGNDGWGWFEFDAEGYLFDPLNECRYSPSTDWAQGGPITEREQIATRRSGAYAENFWSASKGFSDDKTYGPTPLIAALRCYVASKLGDEVEVPEELCK